MTTAMYDHSGFTRVVICFVLIAFTVGCTTMRPVYGTSAASVSARIEVGDKIEITRNDSSSVKFRVTAISDDGISGRGTFVAYSDIRRLQVSTVKPLNNKWAIGILVVLAAAYAISQSECRNDDVVAQYCPN